MARKPVYLPILTTAREKNDYFENLIDKINNNKFSSVRDNNLKTAKDAGFKNATAISFIPNQKLGVGYYTLELAVSDQKLSANSFMLNSLKDVIRVKEKGKFYYTYGKFSSLEEAVKMQKELEDKGIKNTTIQKISR